MTAGQSQQGLQLTRSKDIVLILETVKGRGIFASARIASGTVLETCPVLILGIAENKEHIEKTSLYHYTYNWPITDTDEAGNTTSRTAQAVVLGLGSMFNHSTQHQNVVWTRDTERQLITYYALRDIEAGEELCISYGSHLTFIDADAPSPIDEGDGSQMLGGIELD